MSDVAVVEQRAPAPIVALRAFLDRRISELQTALPAHMSAERFVRVIMTAVQINPELLACDRQTLWNSAMRSANDGLLPDGREAALVPFKGRVQYLPMYQGLLKKFRNSGEFKHINAGIVYEGERFHHYLDEHGEHFYHCPGDHQTDAKIVRVYATATTKDDGFFIAALSLADINKRRNMSRTTREDSPWKQWPDEMMKKTAIRVLAKFLPMSSDLDVLVQRDEEALTNAEAIDETRAQLTERPSTVTALDHFAAGEPETDRDRSSEPDATIADAAACEDGQTESHEGPSSPTSFVDPIKAAEQRGREDRAKGMSIKAVPPEWRTSDKTALAAAWIKGWQEGQGS